MRYPVHRINSSDRNIRWTDPSFIVYNAISSRLSWTRWKGCGCDRLLQPRAAVEFLKRLKFYMLFAHAIDNETVTTLHERIAFVPVLWSQRSRTEDNNVDLSTRLYIGGQSSFFFSCIFCRMNVHSFVLIFSRQVFSYLSQLYILFIYTYSTWIHYTTYCRHLFNFCISKMADKSGNISKKNTVVWRKAYAFRWKTINFLNSAIECLHINDLQSTCIMFPLTLCHFSNIGASKLQSCN